MKAWIRLLMAASAALATQAFGQGYPNKPVHVIISFTPGSSTDIVGRIVSQKLADLWNQPVVPDNRAGAGGSIGSAIVAKAAADGYTLLITPTRIRSTRRSTPSCRTTRRKTLPTLRRLRCSRTFWWSTPERPTRP